MKVLKWFDESFEESILSFLLVIISVVMFAQIIAREVVNSSMSWPEEMCRLCWIWTVFLSLPYTIKKGNMLRVNILVDQFPLYFRKSLFILADLIILGVMTVFFIESFTVFSNYVSSNSMTPAMDLPLWAMYGIVVIAGFGLGSVRAIQILVEHIRTFKERDLTAAERTLLEAQEEMANLGIEAGGEE